MSCQWNSLINILPLWMRKKVDEIGRYTLQEIRMRILQPPELITSRGVIWLENEVTKEDLSFVVNIASKYSPWSSLGLKNGFVTADGGHRIGICGGVAIKENRIESYQNLTSLCIRVARDFGGIAPDVRDITGSILIIGPPGYGKTTLLRDLIRNRSNHIGGAVTVVDEKCEIFPFVLDKPLFDTGKRTDIISGCSKKRGIEIALKNMAPSAIAVDEITSKEDCEAIIFAGWCGVDLIATAHAKNKEDLFSRAIYKELMQAHLFRHLITLHVDKTSCVEELDQCY